MKTLKKNILIVGLVITSLSITKVQGCGTPSDGGTLSGGGTTFCEQGSATLTLTGYVGTIQWQKREEYGQWTDVAGLGASYSPSGIVVSTEYRAEVKNGSCAEDYSNVVSVNIDETSDGGILSGSQSYCDEALGTITLSSHIGTVQKWQTRTNGGSWSDITNTTTSYGYDHETRGIYEYRAVVANGLCTARFSSIATIYVDTPGSINVASQAAYGEEVALQLTNHTGTATEWDWQVSFDDGASWDILDPAYSNGTGDSASFETYDFTILEKTMFKVEVHVNGCTDQYSDSVTVDLNNAATPETDYRQIQSTRLLVAEDDETQIPASGNGAITQISYMNGLGRSLKTVSVASTPDKDDVVGFQAFQAHSTTQKSYLPYVDSNGVGASFDLNDMISAQATFYDNNADSIADSPYPYAEIKRDGSPLGRVLEQGAPGADWQLDSNTVKYNYRTNAAKEVRLWTEEGISDAYYPEASLWVSQMTDENGHQVEQFTDKSGRTVLKRVQTSTAAPTSEDDWAYTYNVYDKVGRLIYVLPPMAVKEYITEIQPAAAGIDLITETTEFKDLVGASDTVAVISPAMIIIKDTLLTTSRRIYGLEDIDEITRVTFLDTWVYQYTYDDRGRLVEKKIPGKAVEYYVYDELDRLLLSQDGILRATDQWTYVKYDRRHRPVMTGLYTNSTDTTRALMQTTVDALDYDGSDLYYEKPNTSSTTHYYTNLAFPTTGTEVLSVSYYDSYDINGNGTANYTYTTSGLSPEPVSLTNVRGLPTVTKIKVLDSSPADWLMSAVFYDKYGRTIQVFSDNHLGGDVTSTTVYDFNGRALNTKTVHDDSSDTVTIKTRNVYDHAGRLQQSFTQVDSDPEIETANYYYNELGQLVSKHVHSEDSGTTYLQTLDYGYNIRGWLKNINDPESLGEDYFGMELLHNDALGGSLSHTKGYNGNITAIKWGENVIGEPNTQALKAYAFEYDAMDRLTDAIYGEGTLYDTLSGVYDEKAMIYDANGNMTDLKRYSNIDSVATKIDDLNYTYTTGNQLDKVDDVSTTSSDMGLNDSTGTDYAYDINGNVIQDNNKSIESITYNYMNKPSAIEFINGDSLHYTYSASGIKLAIELYKADTLYRKTDYSGAFEYLDGVLQYIHTAGGKILPASTGGSDDWEHEYYLTDHLGNVRVAYRNRANSFTYKATMETHNATSEEAEFDNLDSCRFTNAAAANSGDEVAKLNNSQMVGPGIGLPVYPGDEIDMQTHAFHSGGTGYSNLSSLVAFIDAVAGAFGGNSSGTTAEQNIFSIFDNALNTAVGGIGLQNNQTDDRPAAYLNYLLFDKDYNVAQSGFLQVGSGTGGQTLSMQNVIAEKEGFIYIYVSNESSSTNDIYFDDLEVTINESNIVQKNSYYPFGLQHASSWSRPGRENKYQFNAASELNEETGRYEMYFRSYDPVIGRMSGVDPYAEKYVSMTPYHYAGNDPVFFNDPTGGILEPPPERDHELDEQQSGGNMQSFANFMAYMAGGFGSLGVYGGNHWTTGMGRHDWSAQTGSQDYRDSKNMASGIPGSYEVNGRFYRPDGTEIKVENGVVYEWTEKSNVSYRWVDKGDGTSELQEVVSLVIESEWVAVQQSGKLDYTAAITHGGSSAKVKVLGFGFGLDNSNDKVDLAGWRDSERTNSEKGKRTVAEATLGPLTLGREQIRDSENGKIIKDKFLGQALVIGLEGEKNPESATYDLQAHFTLFAFKLEIPWVGVDLEIKWQPSKTNSGGNDFIPPLTGIH